MSPELGDWVRPISSCSQHASVDDVAFAAHHVVYQMRACRRDPPYVSESRRHIQPALQSFPWPPWRLAWFPLRHVPLTPQRKATDLAAVRRPGPAQPVRRLRRVQRRQRRRRGGGFGAVQPGPGGQPAQLQRAAAVADRHAVAAVLRRGRREHRVHQIAQGVCADLVDAIV